MEQQHQDQPPPLKPENPINIIAKAESFSTKEFDEKLAKAEKENLFKDKQRSESYRSHIHLIVVIGIYVIGFIMIVLILIRSYHLVVPERLKWLNTEENHSLEQIIFSGIILSLASRYFKHYKVIDD